MPQAQLENHRLHADLKRFAKTRATMRANKRAQAKALRRATVTTVCDCVF